MTTFRSYATVPSHRQAEIFDAKGAPDAETMQRVLDHLRRTAA